MPPVVDEVLKGAGKKRGLEIWRIKKFALQPLPKQEYGTFYSGDSYIVLNTKHDNAWDVHFWLGQDTSQDEAGTAAIKTVELDQALGGLPVQYREVQFYESALFLSYFKDGIKYFTGGYDSGFHHIEDVDWKKWKPRLFHCKGKRNVRCIQVDCIKESLNYGDVFILDKGLDIFVWMPPESGRLERIKGMNQAKAIRDQERDGEPEIRVLDQTWDSDEDFWNVFGGKDVLKRIKSSYAGGADENYWRTNRQNICLYRVCDKTGKVVVTKVKQGGLNIKDLDTNDAFIVDAVRGGVYIWVGKGCTMKERENAMVYAQKYVQDNDRPVWTQVVRVLEGAEPAQFTQWFSEWTSAKSGKAFEPKLFQVSDESGKLVVEEIANFYQEDLDGDDVMILDGLNIIYVWVGAAANKAERDAAESTAKKYLETDSVPRHKKAAIEVIHQGKEPPIFKKYFPEWDDKMFEDTANRSVANIRKLLFK
ncbi:hypothetical protein QR680_016687 [Steinernema hermaphroditum]|uniref:Gelsolin-like domain-containing protein n=1 Tax=Steinernema hermaphroditum TaxID=289476 RepID=A0AA39LN15_9BILA|nr:hypothetical protein QR680_016687 [Steinernema hermaphroditum]